MTLSPEQVLVVSAVRDTTDNLLISACAGGAKTTTLIECARAIGPGRRIIFLAFNKNIADELAKRLPYFAQASTFHSFCYDALGKHFGRKPRADQHRCKWVLKELVPKWKERVEIQEDVLALVSRAKAFGYGTADNDLTLSDIADRFGIEAGTEILGHAGEILTRCQKLPTDTVDFDDMLWLTLLHKVSFPPVAYILLDEAQDTNVVQRELLKRIPCRLIAVGDPHQAIYGFRGADSSAMSALRDTFAMKEMELSVSWRCSQEVVKEARKYVL